MASSGPPPPNSRDDFEIAIVCALAIEYDAVTLLIDKFWDEHGDEYGRAIRDRNTYTTGRMGNFDVVLLLLPNAGKVSAASAASSLRSSFPNITLALLVGICGGMPYTKDKEEILLGDVVISKTVIQYDLGSQHPEQFLTKETLEERLGRPDPNIRGIVHIMETYHERERLERRAAVLLEQLQGHASRKQTRKPTKYEYPGILKDRLYRSNYVHKHQVLLPFRCCDEVPCDRSYTSSCVDLGCEDDHLVQRQRLNDEAQSLSIFIGRFGSGDTALKSGIYRDNIAQRHGLLAFEMEGAGVWDELPCIIIKGISNYADGHWNADSDWQHFAAATAAATARALIERYPKTDRPHLQLVVMENRRKRTQQEEECLRAMHVTDPALDKIRIEDGGLLKDSYIWILTNAEFTQWRNNPDGGLLWIKGDPGKGKTMLMCGLVDELQADNVTQLHYFFCQASDPRLNSATKVLCSLVYSIACQDQEALTVVMEKYKHAGRELFHNANSWTALSQMLTQILQEVNLENKIFIIDGLDECITDLARLLEFIARAPALSMAKWIISSRNWSNIEEKLNTSSKKLLLSLELNEQSISHAVQVYINHKVDQLADLKKLDKHSRNDVQAYLSANANETFLWVALVYKELFKGDAKKRHLQDLMAAFPSELGPLYARMMEQVHGSRDREKCLQVLEVVSLTYRPIPLLELAWFVRMPQNNDGIAELRDIVATCGSFLVSKNDVVYFVHHSAKDFLLSNASDQMFTRGIARKHHDIFSKSVDILSRTLRRDMYKLRHPGAQTSKASTPNPNPLRPLQYACVYWVDHLRDAGINSSGKTVSQASLQDEGTVHSFLKLYLLQWLEALCLMGKLSEGIIAIRTLESLTAQDLATTLHMFVIDARRLVLLFRSGIEYTPLQLYSSTLLFTPMSSIVRKTFELNHTASWIKQKPSVQSAWDACLQTLEGHQSKICALAYSPDNTKLASLSQDGNVKLWDRATGARLQSLTLDSLLPPKTVVYEWDDMSMVFSPDSSQLALACKNIIKILDLNISACVMTIKSDVYMSLGSMMFSPNGMQLITSDELWTDSCFRIWDLTTGTQLQKEDYYQDAREPAVSQLDSPSESKVSVIRSPKTGSCVRIVSKNKPKRVMFSLDGMQLAMMMLPSPWKSSDCFLQTSIYILDTTTGQCSLYLQGSLYLQEFWSNGYIELAFSPDGTKLAMNRENNGTAHVWDAKTGACLLTLSPSQDSPSYLAFSPDGTELVFASTDEIIKIWDLTLGASKDLEIDELMETEWIQSITYSPDSTRFALIMEYEIKVLDAVTGICQQQFDTGLISYQGNVQSTFSPDNSQLAYWTKENLVIWDLTTNKRQNTFEFNFSGSRPSIIFSPSGARLAVAGTPHGTVGISEIKIWDVANGTVVLTIHSADVIIDVQFSSDSKRLGSVSLGGTAAIWDTATGACLQILDINLEKTLGNIDWSYWGSTPLAKAQFQSLIANVLQNQDSKHGDIHEFDLNSYQSWLLRRGEPFLWLPPEYRPFGMTFAGDSVPFTRPFTHIEPFFFGFNRAQLDAEMALNRSSILKV